MSVPDFQSLLLPMLRFCADGQTYSMADARAHLARELGLMEADLEERLPSGRQTKFANRVAWAKVYLTKAALLISPKRGLFHISERGRSVLNNPPKRIDIRFLNNFEEFQQSRQPAATASSGDSRNEEVSRDTPEETLESAYGQLRSEVTTELLQLIMDNTPEFFEKTLLKLLLAMGYGGSFQDAARGTRRTADEGIDGIIKEDRLGLDTIYLQAKRWSNPVGRPAIQQFVGALQGQRAKKGVFITTSKFSNEAITYASQVDPKVVLIDGKDLAQLMFDYNLGVSTAAVYEVKKVDSDFFIEE